MTTKGNANTEILDRLAIQNGETLAKASVLGVLYGSKRHISFI